MTGFKLSKERMLTRHISLKLEERSALNKNCYRPQIEWRNIAKYQYCKMLNQKLFDQLVLN